MQRVASLRTLALGAGVLLLAPAAGGAQSRADTLELVVAATTDVHGHLRGWDYFAARPDTVRSLARAATVVDSLRAAHPGRVVLVDAGDLLQGTPLTYVAARVAPDAPHPVPAAMNALRYDAAAIGNHEFNYGLETLDRAIGQARFPFLAANARRADGTPAYKAWTMVERGGARVAIVGGTTPGSMVWDRDHLAGKVAIGDIVPAVRDAAAEARRAGADVVVAVLHAGLDGPSSYDTVTTRLPSENVSARVAREIPGLDLVVFGHSHRALADTTIGGALVMQPKNWSESVGVARLSLVRRAGKWAVVARRGQLVPTVGRAESPAVLAATDSAHARAVAYAASAVGTTAVAWRSDSLRRVDTPLVDFMLEVMRRTAGADLAAGAAYADAGLDAGPITVAELARLYPYENTLRAVRVTGAQLRAFLEHSSRYYAGVDASGNPVVDRTVPGYNYDMVAGADYVLDLRRPIGQRVTTLTYRGRLVADTDSFTLALNNYRQTGGGGFAMLAGAPQVHDRGLEIRQLLIEEAKAAGTLDPARYHTRNWRLETGAPTSAPLRVAQDTATNRVRKDVGPAIRRRAGLPRRLRILAMNDFHGALEPLGDARGVVRGGAGPFAAALARVRAECRPPACVSILLDGGDEFQGTPASNLTYGRSVVGVMRELGVVASALGNHEFDWGVDTLRARIRELPYTVLGANVTTDDGRRLPWLPADTLIVRNGLRIGIVGVADPATPRTTKVLNVKGLRFGPPAPAVDERARALRARGADLVVVTGHIGAYCDADRDNDAGSAGAAAAAPRECAGEVVELARQLREPVAAIVSGHTHSRVATVVNGIPIVQARTAARALGVIDLPLDGGAPTVEVREVIADSVGAVPARMASLVSERLAEVRSKVEQRIVEVADAMPREPDEQYALGNVIADAQRWATRADVAIMNNGGIRTGLPAGTATFGRLYEIQPFGNTLYTLRVRGRDLKAYLPRLVARDRPRWHVSGVSIVYDTTRAGPARFVSATLDGGRAIEDDQLYAVTINDFLVTGGDGVTLAEGAASVTATNVVDVDALIGYLRQLPQPVRAPSEVRIRNQAEGAR
ncbi:5'-nucleotidase C-terminal domain-containing protein [Roseisolibacter sp. H3M3-2]|uniref:5'-nucleotidase C-terminal domain-containing protein n=1 Tax=Roseisolibacter sp. H3M3-2 TaxID=3031323 RepID=UPI0023DA69C1|nr:5'-nucleotidase C-terminal domain-containing protein [Roseisolibacter sp. H3M3-2]MDF1501907.1 5'-nucleotidase C-terminal domain-containing protein [Roseisolibacter sp. H3M3-2]